MKQDEHRIRVKHQVVRYATAMESLALSLLPVFATALDLDENFFEEAFKSPMFRLRLSHYPPAPPDTDQYGIAPHTDTSFLTLLAQVVFCCCCYFPSFGQERLLHSILSVYLHWFRTRRA